MPSPLTWLKTLLSWLSFALLPYHVPTPKPRTKPGILWFFAIFLLSVCRIGEAAHPGPTPDGEFALGCANANNLLSKADVVAKLPEGIWVFSETCLTHGGIEHFQKNLKMQPDNAGIRFLPGAPAPRISSNAASIGGKHVGVGFCTKFPARPLTNDWSPEIWSSARVQTAGIHVGQWIRGGIAYGFAKDCHTPKVLAQTHELLQAITNRIVLQSHGPRFLMGDFNLETDQIELAQFWQDHGFVEAQTFAYHQWGQEPKKTCKNCTIKDHVWLSRELLPFVQSVTVDSTWFSDHALLYVTLSPLGPMEHVPIWRRPHALPWEQVQEHFANMPALEEQPNQPEFYRALWQHLEAGLDGHLQQAGLPGLTPQQRGRACTTEVTWVRREIPPLKRSRKSDIQIQFAGDHWQHFHWTRQLRRIQSYCHLVKPRQDGTRPMQEIQKLWRSILTAPGFPKGFRKYWPTRAVQAAGTLPEIPRAPPDYEASTRLLAGFLADFTAMEKALIKHRRVEARKSRLEDPHRIYKDTAQPRAMPVQTLLTSLSTTVEEATEEGRISYPAGDLDLDLPVSGPNGPLLMAQHQPGLILTDPDAIQIGDCLTQERWLAKRTDMFTQFADLWTKRWDKHRDTPGDTWQPFCQFVETHLPQPPEDMPYHPITLQVWMKEVQRKRSSTAAGPDGVSKQDLMNMPVHLTNQMLEMFWHIEQGAPWPTELLTGLITAIEKHQHAADPAAFRPICVLSLAYRTWASIRTKEILSWLAKFSPPGLIGNRSKKETAHIWWSISAMIERTWYDDTSIHGCISDIVKCYNCCRAYL